MNETTRYRRIAGELASWVLLAISALSTLRQLKVVDSSRIVSSHTSISTPLLS
jgi:hypothetical protein